MEIQAKWFDAVTPTNANYATAQIGSGSDGTVTITYGTLGTEGNVYEIAVEVAEGNSANLAAVLSDGVITVTLGTTSEGAADATKNTATLIAAKISEISGFSATASGTGDTAISTETSENVAFTGGTYCTISPIGDIWLYIGSTYYYCSKPCDQYSTDAWKTVVFTDV